MNVKNKKVWLMIVVTIILANVYAFAQNQQGQQQPRPVRTPPVPLTERLLKAYMDLPDAQRKAENKRFLEMYNGLRVADVRDGMDWFGYHHYGSLDPAIRPMWKTYAFGIARTAKYLPYVGPAPIERGQEYDRWQGMYYNEISTYPWVNDIEPGDFVALDMSGVDVGLLGSENTLRCLANGVRGFVMNGSGMRDTDEGIMQKIPVWNHFLSQAMVQARIQFGAKDIPVAIGGVTIFPGDIIVADNDGVIVVPRAAAEQVAKQAHRMLSDDKSTRKASYDKLGWAYDDTVLDNRAERDALYKRMGWDDMIKNR